MEFLMDTHAWVEYFRGSKVGASIQKIVENPDNTIHTAECSIAELWDWANREHLDFDDILKTLMSLTAFSPIELSDWIKSAQIKKERRQKHPDFGLMDALILCKQRQMNCKLMTGDPHFEDLPGVSYYGHKHY